MTSIILFISFFIMILLTVPVGIALAASTIIAILYSGALPVEYAPRELITALDSFPLLALPFFILAGDIMGKGGISSRLSQVANSIVGSRVGGLAMASIITSMFFAAISGSGPATVAAVGAIMIPEMIREGYDKKFATAVVVSSGSLGVIIPPSISMVLYGVVGQVSIGDLFIAGIIPGIIIGFCLMIWAYIYSRIKGYKGSMERFSFKYMLKTMWRAKWALLLPVVIIGGIYGGFFTPTESAVVAVVFAISISIFVYKELLWSDLPGIFISSSLTSAIILIIVAAATIFGRMITLEQIPGMIASTLLGVSQNDIVVMLLILLLLILLGTFMETGAALIIATPLLLPLATEMGYNPVHFGIIMIVSLAIGFITPPVGMNLFVGSSISGVPVMTLAKAVIPFLITMLIALIIITFIPALSLLLLQ